MCELLVLLNPCCPPTFRPFEYAAWLKFARVELKLLRLTMVLLCETYVLWLYSTLPPWCQSYPQPCQPQPKPANSPTPKPSPKPIPGPSRKSPGYGYHPGKMASGAPYTSQGSY